MTRDLGLVAALQSLLPPELIGPVVLVTHAGSAPVLFGLVALRYWLVDRDREGTATLLGLTIAAVALVVVLKAAFGLPRPTAARHLVAADGFGFPSGHALQATVVYGGLALLSDRFRPRRRWALAAAVIAAVAASRVVLGVHFAVDVVAGVAAGATLLWAGWRLADGRPNRAFAIAVGLAALAVVASAAGPSSIVAIALAVGGLSAWQALPPPHPVATASGTSRLRRLGLTAIGLGLLGGLGLVAVGPGPTPVALLAGLLAGGITIGLPGAGRLPCFGGARTGRATGGDPRGPQ